MIFKTCPQCGGSVVRLRDETGDKFLSCQKCTWASKVADDKSPSFVQTDSDKIYIPVWFWVFSGITLLAVLALLIFCPPK